MTWSQLERSRPTLTIRMPDDKRMSFNLQPVLKGDLLELRPLRAEDFRDLYAAASDPLIWEQHPVKDRYKIEVFDGFFHEALNLVER